MVGYLDECKVREKTRPFEASLRPCRALASRAYDTIQIHSECTSACGGAAHRGDVPRDQQLGRPTILVFAYGMLPVPVPVRIEVRFIADDRVVDSIRAAERECISRATIPIKIDHHIDAIDLRIEVPLHSLPRARHGR